mmetsp:Transcript_13443/g.44471  ORF Transcript_13443/g.44471 Transcript_13443/m.44471 type:complete len:223 (+) Transcript_13443:1180-1848(+)
MLEHAQYPTVCSLMYFQCFSCLASASAIGSIAARYIASATSSTLHGFTRKAPERELEHPTNSLIMSDERLGAGKWSPPVPVATSTGPCLHVMYSYGNKFMPSRVAVTTAQSATLISATLSANVVLRCSNTTTLPWPISSSLSSAAPSVTPYVAFKRSTVAATSACSSCISRPVLRAGLHTCTRHMVFANSGCRANNSSNACSFSSMPLKMSMSSTPRNTFLP